jgi:hypothetical protein
MAGGCTPGQARQRVLPRSCPPDRAARERVFLLRDYAQPADLAALRESGCRIDEPTWSSRI